MQSRRSLLIWKVYGQRLDGWNNDDLPYESVPGDANSLRHKGQAVPNTPQNRRLAHIGYVGGMMPPPEAVAGNYIGADGKKISVPGLSDEEKMTLVRWIDLGCPIDFEYDATQPATANRGWLLDDQRPTLTLTEPRAGANGPLKRILIGAHDAESGLDAASLQVTASFPLDGVAPGQNLAAKFQPASQNVWEYRFAAPLADLGLGTLTVTIKDRQGNQTKIERAFSVR